MALFKVIFDKAGDDSFFMVDTLIKTQPLQLHQWLENRYELISLLGYGGCSRVYGAIDHQSAGYLRVAIKVLRTDLTIRQNTLAEEYEKLQRIRHINVVQVFGISQQNLFFVMELLEGRSLSQLIGYYQQQGGLPRHWALLLTRQLISALTTLHRAGLIHRDLKPGNLFFNKQDGQLKIIDFGMAQEKEMQYAGHYSSKSMDALTPVYASLEMLSGADADARDDIYSAGCVIYEMLTGRHPFDRLSADQAAVLNLVPEPIEWLSQAQWHVLSKSLVLNRENRVADISEFSSVFEMLQ